MKIPNDNNVHACMRAFLRAFVCMHGCICVCVSMCVDACVCVPVLWLQLHSGLAVPGVCGSVPGQLLRVSGLHDSQHGVGLGQPSLLHQGPETHRRLQRHDTEGTPWIGGGKIYIWVYVP